MLHKNGVFIFIFAKKRNPLQFIDFEKNLWYNFLYSVLMGDFIMFWEIKEYFRKLFSMTIRPAMKNLFSSKKSALGMLCVMLILQMLLSVICITGVENIATQRDILEDHNADLAKYENINESDEPDAATSTDYTSDESASGSGTERLMSSEVSAALSGVPIFAGFLSLWTITAIIVYQRLSSASADRDKYMWGMYVTYGAHRKKVRNILKYELYTVLLVATLPSYFIALKLCNILVSAQGYKYSFGIISFLLVLLISYICIRLVVTYEVKLIERRSCTELLKEEEGPSKLARPKRSGRLRLGFSPLRYAMASFTRLRKYYITLALAAAVPAIIWICCQTAAYSQNQYLSSDINEYNISFENGISEKELENIFSKRLSEIEGISSVRASATYPADEISSFIIADISQYKSGSDSILHAGDAYADGDAILACANYAFKNKTGFSANVPKGNVTVLLPSDDTTYSLGEGDYLYLAVSRLDGTVRASVTDVNAKLSEDISEECEYKLFKINKITSLKRAFSSSNFLNIENPYFLFNEEDFTAITSISADSFEQDIHNSDISFDGVMKPDASLDITIRKSDLSSIPDAGDTILLRGDASCNITLKTAGGETLQKLSHMLSFNTVNINSVIDEGERIKINATPRASVVMKPDMVEPTVILFGLPKPLRSVPDNSIYLSHDVNEGDITIEASFVSLDFDESVLYTDPSVRAIDAGTHIKLGGISISDEARRNKLFLESLYASNLFDIVCGDKTTSETLGTDITVTESGTAVVVLPTGYAHDFAFNAGDILRINTTTFDVSMYERENWQLNDAKERLSEAIKHKSEYQKLEITDVVYSDAAEKPMLILCGEDFARALGKTAPYTQLAVFLDNDIDSERYAALNQAIEYELQKISDLNPGNGYISSVSSTGAFLDFMLKKNANYGLWISVIGILIPMTLPFIWYYPLATLFERRKHDYLTLKNLGKKKSNIISVFFIEGFMVALCALLAISLLCYPCMYVFDFVCFFFELPIDFNVSYLSPANFISAVAAGVACVALSFVICYFISAPRAPKKQNSRKIKEKADGYT